MLICLFNFFLFLDDLLFGLLSASFLLVVSLAFVGDEKDFMFVIEIDELFSKMGSLILETRVLLGVFGVASLLLCNFSQSFLDFPNVIFKVA